MKGIDKRKVAAIDVLFYLHVHMCLAHAFKKLQHKTTFNRKHICTLYGVWMELTKGNIHTISVPKLHECLPSPGASWSNAFIALVSTKTVVFNSTLYSVNTARPWLLMVAVPAFEH